MPLGGFFKTLLAEKHADTFTLIQDNPTRSANPATVYKEAPSAQKKQRPSLANSNDCMAPKLPCRQTSDEELGHLHPPTMLSRNMMGESLYRNEKFACSKTASASSSPSEEGKESHVFASFCDETKGILMQLPASRYP
ncbi:unnamed protein product [Cylindrotheca closterium]|uniref:Uncharacterized protein n=1 Tax=Cylindrotheca closterium TaxID=2856 RepID=A0AAD2FDX2_9STRA|nr:unnamed protein product [Cylindrotheca closterium]